MLALDTSTKLEVVLAAVPGAQAQFFAAYIDSANDTAGHNDGTTNSTTDVIMVAAPGSGTRLVRHVSVYNPDTATITVTVKVDDGANERILVKKALDAGQTLIFDSSSGWIVLFAAAAKAAGQIWLSVRGGWASTTSGCATPVQVELATNKGNVWLAAFDKDAKEFMEWTLAMPSDYNGGTITAVFYWTANSASTDAVVWGLQGRAFADDDALDQAFGTAQSVTDANKAVARDLSITVATSAIALAGTPVAGQMVQLCAYRDAVNGADTLAVDAELIGVLVTFTRS